MVFDGTRIMKTSNKIHVHVIMLGFLWKKHRTPSFICLCWGGTNVHVSQHVIPPVNSPCSKWVKNWIICTRKASWVCLVGQHEGQQTWCTTNAVFLYCNNSFRMQLILCTCHVFFSQNDFDNIYTRWLAGVVPFLRSFRILPMIFF